MSHIAAPLRVLLISLLVLLSTGQPGSIAAGTVAVQSPAFTCDGVSEIPVKNVRHWSRSTTAPTVPAGLVTMAG